MCPSDIDYLQSIGGDFCTSYNGYQAPTATSTVFDTTYTTTVAVVTAQETSTVVIHATTTYVQLHFFPRRALLIAIKRTN